MPGELASQEKQTGALTVVQAPQPLTVAEVLAQVSLIRQVMEAVMKQGTHYGVIPGTEKYSKGGEDISKPTLYQPGAQTLLLTFRMHAYFDEKRQDFQDGHREYFVKTTIRDSAGNFMSQGVGSCSTLESKYRYRRGDAYTDTGHAVPSSYWNLAKPQQRRTLGTLMDDMSGNYGVKKVEVIGNDGVKYAAWHVVKFPDDAKEENPNIADTYNTVLKMAKKRSLVDAALNATAASDTFTQDLEEIRENLVVLQETTGIDLDDTREPQQPAASVSHTPEPEGAAAKKDAVPIPLADWKNVRVHVSKSRVNGKRLGEIDISAIKALKTGWADKLEATATTREDRRLIKGIQSALIENAALGEEQTLKRQQRQAATGSSAGDNASGNTSTAPAEQEGHSGALNASVRNELIGQVEGALIAHDISAEDFDAALVNKQMYPEGIATFYDMDEGNLQGLLGHLRDGLLMMLGFIR